MFLICDVGHYPEGRCFPVVPPGPARHPLGMARLQVGKVDVRRISPFFAARSPGGKGEDGGREAAGRFVSRKKRKQLLHFLEE